MYVSVLRGDCGKRYVSVLCVCWVGYWLVVLCRGIRFACS